MIDANRIVHGAKVIGVVSSVPNEGKTTVGANLASLMVAATGARTLLIDSDFHVRKLSATMAPNAREGLLEAMQDPARLPWMVTRREALGRPRAAHRVGGPHAEFGGAVGSARDGATARCRPQIL